MLTVQQHGITYRFRTRLYEAGDHLSSPYEILIERRIYFENTRAAVAFLRRFKDDAFAVRGFRQMLSKPGFGSTRRHDEMADDWMDQLGLHLVTGRLAVIESIPRVPSGDSSERSGTTAAPVSRPAPRRETPPPRVEEPEHTTFSTDADEEAQVQALVEAAQAGTPFCEACARAAAQERELQNA